MANIDHLYSDQDWLLQAGMADIEHEQFMYDQMKYGDPIVPEWQREILLKDLESKGWPPLADYDELGIMGLRKHAMSGPLRYLFNENLKEESRQENIKGQARWGYEIDPLPSHLRGPWNNPHKKGTWDKPINQIDINLDQVISDWNPSMGSLQDYIAEVYRHEYKHPLNKSQAGIPKDPYSTGKVSHHDIYATGALFGKSRQGVLESLAGLKEENRQDMPRPRARDRGPSHRVPTTQRAVGPPARNYSDRSVGPPGYNYSTGGIVSLAWQT